MNGKKRRTTKRRPLSLRVLAMVLALAMLFTSSSFQVFAESVTAESDAAAAEAAAQAAAESEAQRLAEEQAAAEAAAQAAAESEAQRLAEEQAASEAAAAQAAAESEAQRLAEEQAASEAAAAQAAAESEAQRLAQEQAAAEAEAARIAAEEQAAAESEAARKAAEQQAAAESEAAALAASEGTTEMITEAVSEETDPVIGGKLVLKTEPASTQNAGEYAKLRVEYGLGAECQLASVETRLYVWNENAVYPQFANETNSYTDPASGRTFTLKVDSEGDTYIECMLKPGESFIQEFLFGDSSVTPGTEITFDAVISAMGEIPADQEIQTTAAKITYAVPAEETEAVTEETVEETTEESIEAVTEEVTEEVTEPVSEEGTEAATEEAAEEITEAVREETTEAASETAEETEVLNTVSFEVAEGASVTVNGADATNATAMATNGTIVFQVAAAEGYEVTEILVDGTIPARTTGNDGEYIIENIQTDETVVVVTTRVVETEEVTEAVTEEVTESETELVTEAVTEEMTESETELVTEEVTESETEEVTEKTTEEETEVEYGTSFKYSDGEVTVIADVDSAAKIPVNAELNAERMTGEALREAVATAENELASDDIEAEYVFYDIYFMVDGVRVEPAEGLVRVSMSFATPVFEKVSDEQEVIDYSVIHISDNGQVQDVTDEVEITDQGTVEAVGFTTDSFSPFGVSRMLAVNESGTTLLSEGDKYNIENVGNRIQYTILVDGNEYTNQTISRDSQITVYLEYQFSEKNKPTEKDCTGYYYTLPINISELELTTSLQGIIRDPLRNQAGRYSINEETGVVTFNYDSEYIKNHPNEIKGTFELRYSVNKDEAANDDQIEIDLGDVDYTIKLQDSDLEGTKTYVVNPETGNYVFSIVLTASDADVKNVEVTDTLKGNLEFVPDTFKAWADGNPVAITSEINGQTATITVGEIKYGQPVTITYEVKPDLTGTGENSNTASWEWSGTGGGGGHSGGSGSIDVDFDKNNLTKTSDINTVDYGEGEVFDGTITYTVKINELGRTLVGGDNATITLVDTLDADVSLDRTSVLYQ